VSDINILNAIYSRIPKVECKRPCADCCGLVPIAPIEMENIANWVRDNGGVQVGILSVRHIDCPFLVNSECSIYPVRPLWCRLFPVVNHPMMFCEHGVKPKELLTQAEADSMIKRVFLLRPSKGGK
jgi:Fe-S-cluster containining protein